VNVSAQTALSLSLRHESDLPVWEQRGIPLGITAEPFDGLAVPPEPRLYFRWPIGRAGCDAFLYVATWVNPQSRVEESGGCDDSSALHIEVENL